MIRCHPCLSRFRMLHHIKLIKLLMQISPIAIKNHGTLHKRQMRCSLLLTMQPRQHRNPETGQRLVITARGRVHRAHSLVVGANTLAHRLQCKLLAMQRNVIRSYDNMRSMSPRSFRQASRFKSLHQQKQIILRINYRQAASHAAIISRQRVYACAEWSP